MKVLFSTQGESLRLFNALLNSFAQRLPVGRAGFTVADSFFYDQWLKEEPDFEKRGHVVLKEWEVTAIGEQKPDLAKLARYEAMLGGEAGLFGAIVADRRLLMGPDCTYSQDYRRRFSDDQLLCILQKGLEETERLFDELEPDVVVGFICVTMLDYLVYLFARARGVRYFNLSPTRIGDRISLVSTLNDPSPELSGSFARILKTAQSPHMDLARRYLKRVREEHARYEGVVCPSDKPALKLDAKKLSKVDDLLRVAASYRKYRCSAAASDNHVPDPARMRFFSWVRNPLLAKKVRKYLQPRYVTAEHLAKTKYVFFPLHTEPEVSLLVYGRPYLNQTEIIRMLALSLPVDTVLVVKEHPWMVGKRSLKSYAKMLEIPRVRLADPRLEARVLIQGASLVSVVTGSVGLEAAMLGKPVLTFGDCPFNLLPMVRRCEDPRRLQSIIREMLERTVDDEAALESYVSAVYETSESVSLYSVLLNKKNVHTERGVTGYRDEVDKLSAFLHSLLAESPSQQTDGAAAW